MYLYKLGQQLFVFFMKDLTTMLLFIKHCAILNYFMILTELWLHSLMTTRMAIVWLMKGNQWGIWRCSVVGWCILLVPVLLQFSVYICAGNHFSIFVYSFTLVFLYFVIFPILLKQNGKNNKMKKYQCKTVDKNWNMIPSTNVNWEL